MSQDQEYTPSITEAIDKLKYSDEWKVIVGFVKDLREASLGDLADCKDPYEVMKLAGGTARLDELLAILKG